MGFALGLVWTCCWKLEDYYCCLESIFACRPLYCASWFTIATGRWLFIDCYCTTSLVPRRKMYYKVVRHCTYWSWQAFVHMHGRYREGVKHCTCEKYYWSWTCITVTLEFINHLGTVNDPPLLCYYISLCLLFPMSCRISDCVYYYE